VWNEVHVVLQCVAEGCGVLQCVAVGTMISSGATQAVLVARHVCWHYVETLQHDMHIVLQCVAVCCSVLQCVAACCNMHFAVRCNVCVSVCCSVLLCVHRDCWHYVVDQDPNEYMYMYIYISAASQVCLGCWKGQVSAVSFQYMCCACV